MKLFIWIIYAVGWLSAASFIIRVIALMTLSLWPMFIPDMKSQLVPAYCIILQRLNYYMDNDEFVFCGFRGPGRWRSAYPPGDEPLRKERKSKKEKEKEMPKHEVRTSAFNLNQVDWLPAYKMTDVKIEIIKYGEDEPDRLLIRVKNFHTETYDVATVITGFVRWCERKRIDFSNVLSHDNMYPLFEYLLETAQFPYPYEVAIGITHYKGADKLLISK